MKKIQTINDCEHCISVHNTSQIIMAWLVLLYAFFWVIRRRLNYISRRFGTLCLFHLHKRINMKDD